MAEAEPRRVPACQPASSGDTKRLTQDENRININPKRGERYGANFRPKSSLNTKVVEWRRRESNEKIHHRKDITTQELTQRPDALPGYCQETDGTNWLDLSSVDTRLRAIIEAWGNLPKHIRDVVSLLCDDDRDR